MAAGEMGRERQDGGGGALSPAERSAGESGGGRRGERGRGVEGGGAAGGGGATHARCAAHPAFSWVGGGVRMRGV